MEILNTRRLFLLPLRPLELQLRLSSPEQLERLLNLRFAQLEMPGPLKEAYRKKIALIDETDADYLLLTYWQFILREEGWIIGEAGFKNLPDCKGDIEIGYGIVPDFRGKGYAREGVEVLTRWALGREDVQGIIATTAKGNIPSQKVLESGGWVKTGADKENIFWRLSKKNGKKINTSRIRRE